MDVRAAQRSARTDTLPTGDRLRRHLAPPAIVLRPPPHVPDAPVGEGPRVLREDLLDASEGEEVASLSFVPARVKSYRNTLSESKHIAVPKV